MICKVFGYGYAEIVATISAALCTCLGTILRISTAEYNRTAAARVSDFNTYHGTHEPSDCGDFTV